MPSKNSKKKSGQPTSKGVRESQRIRQRQSTPPVDTPVNIHHQPTPTEAKAKELPPDPQINNENMEIYSGPNNNKADSNDDGFTQVTAKHSNLAQTTLQINEENNNNDTSNNNNSFDVLGDDEDTVASEGEDGNNVAMMRVRRDTTNLPKMDKVYGKDISDKVTAIMVGLYGNTSTNNNNNNDVDGTPAQLPEVQVAGTQDTPVAGTQDSVDTNTKMGFSTPDPFGKEMEYVEVGSTSAHKGKKKLSQSFMDKFTVSRKNNTADTGDTRD